MSCLFVGKVGKWYWCLCGQTVESKYTVSRRNLVLNVEIKRKAKLENYFCNVCETFGKVEK